jgi:hypothetical protein
MPKKAKPIPTAHSCFFPLVHTSGRACLAHNDLTQPCQNRLDPLPDPARDVFTGWVLKALDLIEIVMIELLIKRLESALDIGEVGNPALWLNNRAPHMQLDPEGVPVQPPAFVPFREVRQPMRRFEGELLEDFHQLSRAAAFLRSRSGSAPPR